MAIRAYVQAFRRLGRQPFFSLLTIWTIAIGIGASAAVFAPLDALLLRPLPFERSERLVRLFATNPAQGVERAGMAWGDFLDVRSASRSLESVASYRTLTATRTGGERPEVVQVALVTAGLFDVLRANPALGAGFAPAHEQPGQEAVVVLSHAYWQSRFDGSPQVVGRSVELEGQPHAVLGVMPEGFAFPDAEVQMWAPLALASEAPDRLSHYLPTIGRLASNADLAVARRELSGLAGRLAGQYPESNEGWGIETVPFQESLVARFRPALRVLAIAVGLLMAPGASAGGHNGQRSSWARD